MNAKMKTWLNLFVVLLFVSLLTQTAIAANYNMTVSLDYTGPYAVIMPAYECGHKALLAWWNETKGKEIGIKLLRKGYDMRYDPSVVASTWPGILTGDKPIVHLGLGGPDVAALMKRLPKDKVLMLMSTGTYGFVWKPNMWVFQPRPTYAHEAAGFFNWAHMNQITDRPIRIAAINSKVSPAYVDMINGLKSFAKVTPWAEFVGVEWVPMKPVTLISEVRRLSRKKPDFIWVGTNTVHVIGTLKAQKELGIHIPVLMSSHCGIPICMTASKNPSLLEGHYDSAALDPALDSSLPGARIVAKYAKKLGIKRTWDVMTVQSAVQMLLALRTVERAAAMAGPDNITGEVMRKAMFVKPYTQEDLLGLAPTLIYTNAAPFSEKDLKVKCTTVKNRKHVSLTKGWITVPEVPKWVK